MNEKSYDVLIVGAGLSGLLTAYALSWKGLNIAIIDRSNFLNEKNINFDLRTTAIAEGSKIFFDKIGLWKKINNYSEPIKRIKVLDRNIADKIDFENPDKKSYLGYIVENKYIKKVLLKYLVQRKNVSLFPKNELSNIENLEEFVYSKTNQEKIKSKILIAADGKNSFVRKLIKTPIYSKNYKQSAMVVNLDHIKDHKNIAYEIFSNSGPIALLPMKSKKKSFFSSSVIWSNKTEYLENLIKTNDDHFKLILEESLNPYIGKILNINSKKIFKLSAHINSNFYDNQIIYIGDAAHSVHPIAGQGWNLGVKDIENLIYSLDLAFELGLDIGDSYISKKYNDLSYKNSYFLYQITDKLNSIFLSDNTLVNHFRKFGFSLIDQNLKINNFISSFAMGKNRITPN